MRSVKYPLLLCFSVFVPFVLFSQKTYQFRLIDQVSKQPVPYATVGFGRLNVGASTDSEGKLNLISFASPSDSIFISCLGYELLCFSSTLLSLEKLNVYELNPKQYALQEITIKPEKLGEPITLNQIDKKKYKIGHFVSNYSSQVARKFTLDSSLSDQYLLSSVSFLMKRFPSHQLSTFRVRIYRADPVNGKPGPDLLTVPLIRTVTQKNEIIKVDLRPYRIYTEHSVFYVAIEWLKTEANAITLNNSDSLKIHVAYLPLVGVRNSIESYGTAWSLNYDNSWSVLFRAFSQDLAISAEVIPLYK